MFLRDEEFDTLSQLCACYDRDPEEVKAFLQEHGFVYDETQRQFRPIGYDMNEDL